MKFIEDVLSVPLGELMYLCYKFISNYAVAIILFTLITKIILLPVSIWLQKNSVKIVRITPEINRIKAKYFGDRDTIAEKTAEVYKREKYNPFSSIIPLLVQIILLMGLVQVIYNPLTFIFKVDSKPSNEIVNTIGKDEGLDLDESSVQMQVVDAIKKKDYSEKLAKIGQKYDIEMDELTSDIKKSNMSLCGKSLALIPADSKGITLLVPILAALAAWFLCVMQNILNPLQAEQGNANKYGTMIFSVGLSLFLAFFVPIGVGIYWIWSNIFSVLQQVLLNVVINPKRYIDYEALEDSKKELEELSQIGGKKKKLFEKDPYAKKEKADYKRFFSVINKHLVVYAEGNGYYKYFKDIVEYILEHSNVTIHYITSDPEDNIFNLAEKNDKIRAYYISEKKLITLMMKLECDIFLTSTPDLENFHLKRSYIQKDIEYIFTNHAMNSDNLTLRTHALDHFDTIFCTGPHVVAEQRAIEKLYNLPEKKLVETGYTLLDNMKKDYDMMEKKENDVKTVLIAPSWQKDNIMDSCLDELLDSILKKGYKVIVRPHPQYVRIYKEKIANIEAKFQQKYGEKFNFEKDFSSNKTVYTADVLVTDWSSIAYEFSFTTYKPTLYINTPMKIMNPEYDKIDVVPFDIKVREELGAELDLDRVEHAGELVENLIEDTSQYYNDIAKLKEESFYGLGEAAKLSGDYILQSLKEKISNKNKSKKNK